MVLNIILDSYNTALILDTTLVRGRTRQREQLSKVQLQMKFTVDSNDDGSYDYNNDDNHMGRVVFLCLSSPHFKS